MTDFEPVRFDLLTGKVQTGQGERALLIPLSALEELSRSAGAAAASRFARDIGLAIGKRIGQKLGSADGVRAASLETFVSALAMEVALAGWGTLSLERWGRAMVVLVDHAPVQEHAIVAALVEGAIHAATGREAHAAALGGHGPIRVLIASEKTASQARAWTAEGVSHGEVLARIQAPAPAGGGS
jgi:hypothetical protein